MFKCEKCGNCPKPKTSCKKVVLRSRKRYYSGGGVGWEIVKEANYCPPCAKKFEQGNLNTERSDKNEGYKATAKGQY